MTIQFSGQKTGVKSMSLNDTKPVVRELACGEGIYPRSTAKQSPIRHTGYTCLTEV